MRRSKAILKKQFIKRRRPWDFSRFLRIVSLIGSFALKSTCLLAGLITISLLFLYLYQYLLTSPYLRIEHIIVEGLDEATEEQVLKMSQQNLNSSLLAANLDDLKKTIEKDPWIDSVELHKRLPHTLVILAQKEKPWAVVVLGDLYYMNRKGKMFKKVSHNENIDYPLITGISGTGDDKEMQLKLAAQVLGTLEREKGSWALDELSEVHVNQNGNVSLFFRSLPVIVKVKGSELEAKIDELKRVVAHLNRTGRISLVKEINLNYRDGAVVSFKNS